MKIPFFGRVEKEKARAQREQEVLRILNEWNSRVEQFRSIQCRVHCTCDSCKSDRVSNPERFTSPTFTFADLIPIATYLSKRADSVDLLKQLASDHLPLQRRLEQVEPTYRYGNEGEPSYVAAFRPLQRLRVSMLLDSLQNNRFVNQIGELVDLNLRYREELGEVGGIITCHPQNGLAFHTKPSLSKRLDSFALNARVPIAEATFALFHLHALEEDSSRFAGPSVGSDGLWSEEPSDITTAVKEATQKGQFHGVVVTSLPGKRFNIDYYGAQMGNFYVNVAAVSDLGNYKYKSKKF